MSIETYADIAMIVIFIIATVVYLKYGGNEYSYDENGKLVREPAPEPAPQPKAA